MSLFDRISYSVSHHSPSGKKIWRQGLGNLLAAAGMVFVLSGCTVQPLYSTPNATTATAAIAPDMRAKLASIAIDPADTIYGQQVRNQLIFGLAGGAGQPAQPTYYLDMGLSRSVYSAVSIDVGDTTSGRPSAGTVRLRSNYKLRDAAGEIVANGQLSVNASYDRPRQEFATLRAERDAEKRAAEELAQFLVLSLAQKLSGK